MPDELDPDPPWLMPLVALGLGVLLLVGTVIANELTANAWAERTASVTGTVVGHRMDPLEFDTEVGPVRAPTYCPIVAYIVDGRRFTVDAECGPATPTRGVQRQVRYDPRDPANAVVVGWWERWGVPLVFALPGAVFTVGGLGWLVHVLLRRRRRMTA